MFLQIIQCICCPRFVPILFVCELLFSYLIVFRPERFFRYWEFWKQILASVTDFVALRKWILVIVTLYRPAMVTVKYCIFSYCLPTIPGLQVHSPVTLSHRYPGSVPPTSHPQGVQPNALLASRPKKPSWHSSQMRRVSSAASPSPSAPPTFWLKLHLCSSFDNFRVED